VVTRQGERDSEEPLDDAFVDLAREVDALLELARLLLLAGGDAGHRGERGGLAQDPQEVALGVAHRLGGAAAVGEDHPDPAPASAHRRADDRRAAQLPDVLDRQLVL